MKTIKRSIALVLAMILTLAMSVTVFAAPNADQNTFSLTLNKAVKGHTYEAYQILSGDLSADKATLSNIKWGEGINAKGQATLGDATAYAKTLADLGNNSEALKEQAQIIGANLESASGSVTVTDPDANNVISGLKPGYYLIKDKDNSLKGQESYTEFILHVTDDVDANVKADVPSVEKKVKDTNDTTGKTTGWQDSADYDIGDDVPFQLTATLANNIESYKTYSLKFNDTLSEGLDYNNDAVIKLGDKDVTDRFTPSYDATAKTLTFTCDDILAFGAKNSDKIVVEYTAKLNENAVIGAAGNPNTVYLDFSNNPNNGGEGDRGKTPEDKVIVFTYKLTVNKVDKENKPLTGAEFSLFKKVKVDGKDELELVEVKKILSTNAEGTVFGFTGLDDGTYVLRETKTPDGYNSIEDQTFTISAEHDENSDDPKLTALTGDVASGSIIDLGVMLENGELSTNVVNNKGSVLPSTGGAGRVAIYVIGAILVLGGGIVLVTKKRVR
jgi:fimbrial isopeptide formation D2 family protein/LPXTG-motif cell wall-anchored protein